MTAVKAYACVIVYSPDLQFTFEMASVLIVCWFSVLVPSFFHMGMEK